MSNPLTMSDFVGVLIPSAGALFIAFVIVLSVISESANKTNELINHRFDALTEHIDDKFETLSSELDIHFHNTEEVIKNYVELDRRLSKLETLKNTR